MSIVTPRRADTLDASSSRRELFCLRGVRGWFEEMLWGEWGAMRTARARRLVTWLCPAEMEQRLVGVAEVLEAAAGYCRVQGAVTRSEELYGGVGWFVSFARLASRVFCAIYDWVLWVCMVE